MRDLVQAFSQFLVFSALSAERCIMPEYTVSSVDVQFCLRGFAFFGLFSSVEAWRHTICMQRSTPCRSEDISFLRDGAKCFSEFVSRQSVRPRCCISCSTVSAYSLGVVLPSQVGEEAAGPSA